MIGLKCYDARSKESHRGWAWNRVVERLNWLNKKIEDATVLYLVGPEDIDGDIAVSRGFRRENLIAVDLVQANVECAREKGAIAICDKLDRILAMWSDKPLDLLFIDSCSLVDKCRGFIQNARLGTAIDDGTVLYANMQRGREQSNALKRYPESTVTPHRGIWLSSRIAEEHWESVRNWSGLPVDAKPWGAWLDECAEHIVPQFASYSSNRVTMDSVVMVLPWLCRYGVDHEKAKHLRWTSRTRGKLVAAKAVRTRAINKSRRFVTNK